MSSIEKRLDEAIKLVELSNNNTSYGYNEVATMLKRIRNRRDPLELTPELLAEFALDFHGWYTGKEKSDLKTCPENIKAFSENWMKSKNR